MKRPALGFTPVRIVPAANSQKLINKTEHKKARWDGNQPRGPKQGELYLSGARGYECAFEAPADMTTEFFIAVPCHG